MSTDRESPGTLPAAAASARPLHEESAVRGLARRFAEGDLARRDYIVERRHLLDAIAAGELALPSEPADPVERSDIPPAITTPACAEDITVELPQALTRAVAHDARHGASQGRTGAGGWYVVAGLLLGLLGTATWLWFKLARL